LQMDKVTNLLHALLAHNSHQHNVQYPYACSALTLGYL